jgi:hypothetical protein
MDNGKTEKYTAVNADETWSSELDDLVDTCQTTILKSFSWFSHDYGVKDFQQIDQSKSTLKHYKTNQNEFTRFQKLAIADRFYRQRLKDIQESAVKSNEINHLFAQAKKDVDLIESEIEKYKKNQYYRDLYASMRAKYKERQAYHHFNISRAGKIFGALYGLGCMLSLIQAGRVIFLGYTIENAAGVEQTYGFGLSNVEAIPIFIVLTIGGLLTLWANWKVMNVNVPQWMVGVYHELLSDTKIKMTNAQVLGLIVAGFCCLISGVAAGFFTGLFTKGLINAIGLSPETALVFAWATGLGAFVSIGALFYGASKKQILSGEIISDCKMFFTILRTDDEAGLQRLREQLIYARNARLQDNNAATLAFNNSLLGTLINRKLTRLDQGLENTPRLANKTIAFLAFSMIIVLGGGVIYGQLAIQNDLMLLLSEGIGATGKDFALFESVANPFAYAFCMIAAIAYVPFFSKATVKYAYNWMYGTDTEGETATHGSGAWFQSYRWGNAGMNGLQAMLFALVSTGNPVAGIVTAFFVFIISTKTSATMCSEQGTQFSYSDAARDATEQAVNADYELINQHCFAPEVTEKAVGDQPDFGPVNATTSRTDFLFTAMYGNNRETVIKQHILESKASTSEQKKNLALTV